METTETKLEETTYDSTTKKYLPLRTTWTHICSSHTVTTPRTGRRGSRLTDVSSTSENLGLKQPLSLRYEILLCPPLRL